MKIVIAASEAAPFSKTGGLADVTGTLFREFLKMGIDVSLFVPLYKNTLEQFGEKIKDAGIDVDIPLGDETKRCRVFTLKERGLDIPVFFLSNDEFFYRDELYGTPLGDYPDNALRFIFFSRAVLEVCKKLAMAIDIIHCNDWQTGMIPLYLKTIYMDHPLFKNTRTVITLHNIGYQGIFPPGTMEITGLGRELFNPEGIEFYGNVNFLKAAIISADVITTVSKTYAEEILAPKSGFGLDGALRKRAGSLFGVLNGIDYKEWNPSTDMFIPKRYTKSSLSGKLACKKELLARFSLKGDTDAPLLCFIGRLASQKGIDILAAAIPEIITGGANIVIIGKGEEYYQNMLNSFKRQFSGNFYLYTGFDEPLAHLAYAGSDIFLMPSKYEPCGLGQMIAMRYGTIPVARRTGGLVDTITDCGFQIEDLRDNPEFSASNPEINCTGFLFDGYSPEAILKGIERAMKAYRNKKLWQGIIKNAMTRDFSWQRSARMYLELYSGRRV